MGAETCAARQREDPAGGNTHSHTHDKGLRSQRIPAGVGCALGRHRRGTGSAPESRRTALSERTHSRECPKEEVSHGGHCGQANREHRWRSNSGQEAGAPCRADKQRNVGTRAAHCTAAQRSAFRRAGLEPPPLSIAPFPGWRRENRHRGGTAAVLCRAPELRVEPGTQPCTAERCCLPPNDAHLALVGPPACSCVRPQWARHALLRRCTLVTVRTSTRSSRAGTSLQPLMSACAWLPRGVRGSRAAGHSTAECARRALGRLHASSGTGTRGHSLLRARAPRSTCFLRPRPWVDQVHPFRLLLGVATIDTPSETVAVPSSGPHDATRT